jgi:uncharacterized protein (TIGR00725 family)
MVKRKKDAIYQICVSGSSKGVSVEDGRKLAVEAGKAVARRGHHLLTGATSGIPNYAAQGAKSEQGMSIGLSPAQNQYSHVQNYKLPTDCFDIIFYTGQDFIGRDVLLIQSVDAVISIGGRVGTLHEFAVAMELGKPVGVLYGAGGTSELFDDVLRVAGDGYPPVLHSNDPEKLVDQLVELLDNRQEELQVERQIRLRMEKKVP